MHACAIPTTHVLILTSCCSSAVTTSTDYKSEFKPM